MVSIDHNHRVRLLVSLCRELAGYGLHSTMSDARPALSIRAGVTAPRLWVSVSACGEFFVCCQPAGEPLPSADPETAARHIVDHLRARRSEVHTEPRMTVRPARLTE